MRRGDGCSLHNINGGYETKDYSCENEDWCLWDIPKNGIISIGILLLLLMRGMPYMTVSYKKLWKLLIDKDMMKKDLQEKAGLSWATVTKMSKGETVSMEVLMKVCSVLKCNVGDIVDFVDGEE